jgi:hypothetical protein
LTAADDNDNDEGEYDGGDVVEDGEAAEAQYEAPLDGHVHGGDNDHDDGGPAWDPETQQPDISEEKAVAIAMTNRELNQLANVGRPRHPAP